MELSWWKKFLFILLPTSTVFSWIKDRFFTALIYSAGEVASDIHDANGQNLTDVFPSESTRLDDHSNQFGHVKTLSVERVENEWKQSGGQSPNYLQRQLHDAGLTRLFVHEWWEPGSDPVVARNPIDLISNFQPNNLLVNPVSSIIDDMPQCGDEIYCGDDVYCGDSEGLKYEEKIYSHPDVAAQYPFYFYVCGETFGDYITLTSDELYEAKRVIFKHKPIEQRCVLLANKEVWVNDPYGVGEVWVNDPYGAGEIFTNVGDR